VLLDWSTRFDHLREVTRDDILGAGNCVSGSKRHHRLSSAQRTDRNRRDASVRKASGTAITAAPSRRHMMAP